MCSTATRAAAAGAAAAAAGEVGAAGAGAAVTVPFLKARCSSAPSRRNRWAERADASRDRC